MPNAKTVVFRWIAVLLAPAVLCAGETRLVALRPLYTPETAVLNSALPDLWGDLFSFRIEPDGAGGYKVKDPTGGQDYASFHLVQLGGETIADVVFGQSELGLFQLPVHSLARVRVEGNTLRVDWLGSEELTRQVEQAGQPRHERLRVEGQDDDFLVLTASSAKLQEFVLDCLKRPGTFGESDDFERAGPKDKAADLNSRSRPVVSGQANREAYAAALQQAAEAVRLVPGEPDYWSTLGAAQYRAGAFNEALAALARAEQLRKSASPDDLIFRAMSYRQLGQTAQAKSVLLGDLSKMLHDPQYLGDLQQYCGDQDRRSLFREAEDLISPKEK
jgi:hypothetical protein